MPPFYVSTLHENCRIMLFCRWKTNNNSLTEVFPFLGAVGRRNRVSLYVVRITLCGVISELT
jgi:hypothetical protein